MEREVDDLDGDDEGGGFLLESLATMDTVSIESAVDAQNGDTPRAIIRPKVVQVNTAKALRDIRESQSRMEKRIAMMTGVVVVSLTIATTFFETNLFAGGIEGIRLRMGLAAPSQKVNCALAENRGTDPCLSKKSKVEQSWQSIERSGGGTINHFTLNGM